MSDEAFERVLAWMRVERLTYQQKKFDYKIEPSKPPEYWLQQFASYEQRLPVFGLHSVQGFQAALKLAATSLALCEHIVDRLSLPAPGVPSGEIKEWERR